MTNSLLIVTTKKDNSLPLFQSSRFLKVSSVLYGQSLPEKFFDIIYFRDPFNDKELSQASVKHTINQVKKAWSKAYYVDNVRAYGDLSTEDKWRQYEIFSALIPETELLSVGRTKQGIIKKRISARSKGVHFELGQLPQGANHEDYIIQKRLQIDKEYRVYMIGAEVILPLAIKSSKTPTSRAKMVDLRESLPPSVGKIAGQVYRRLKYDLVGLDIAKTKDGYKLIELNRSPQFGTFHRLSGQNLAEKFQGYLLSKCLKKTP